MAIKFVKQNFMGIELDVLLGHPEHDLLFVASQVMVAAGLGQGKRSVHRYKAEMQKRGLALQVKELKVALTATLKPAGAPPRWADSWLFAEEALYKMLMASKAPQTEPFRKWVTEEVLPSIRKTGTYNIHESETKEAQQFAGEFAQLHSAISELTSEVLSLKEIIAGCQKPSL